MSTATSAAVSRAQAIARYVGVVGALWLLVTLASTRLPLLNVLGYESALLTNLLAVLVGGPALIWRAQSEGTAIERAQHRVRALVPWVFASLLILFVNGLFVRNCDLVAGFGFWAMFGLGGVPVVVAATLLAEAWGGSRRGRSLAIYLAMVLVSFAASGLWLAFQPPLVVYDFFGGFWAVSLYDEALRPWFSHLPFRALTWAIAATIVGALAWREGAGRRAALATLCAAIIAGTLLALAGPLNIARSRAYTEELLGGRIETEHFEIFFEAAGFSKPELIMMVADHERAYAELRAFWGIEPREKLRSFIYRSSETRAAAMGSRSTMIARIWLGETHLTWRDYGDGTLTHELAHLFLRDAGRGPFRVASGDGLAPLMGLVEGAASAATWEFDELDDHGWAAAILRMELLPDFSASLRAPSFWAQPSRVAYTLWSSFSRWLIDTHGVDAYLQVYRDGDFDAAYGVERGALIAEWERFLTAQTLSDAQQATAELRFERASILRRSCGRAIASMESDLRQAMQGRDRARAESCLRWLQETEPGDLHLQLRVARYWEMLGEDAAAIVLYEWLDAHPGASIALRQQVGLRLADAAWRQGDLAAVTQRLQQLRAQPVDAAMDRNLWVREQLIAERIERPRAFAAAQRYLAESWNYRGADMHFDLLSAALEEDSLAATWLAYRLAAGSLLGVAADRLAETLAASELPSSVIDRFVLDELTRAGRLGRAENCRLPEGMALPNWPPGSATAHEARVLRERCEASGLYLDQARRAVE